MAIRSPCGADRWVKAMSDKAHMYGDIRSFFDKVEHGHLEKFVRHRIGDERLVRLILKWVRAGVVEDGQWFETKEGTPQGAVVSPLLANLYLHYVLDLWVAAWRKSD